MSKDFVNESEILENPKGFWEDDSETNEPENAETESVENSVESTEENSVDLAENSAEKVTAENLAAEAAEKKDDEENGTELSEKHDANETLEEKPQYLKDSEKIVDNWENLTDEQKQTKLKNLQQNRPAIFKAVVEKLGIDEKKISQKTDEKNIDDILNEKLGPVLEIANRERFLAETEKYGKHNKFNEEEIKTIQNLDGEIYRKFLNAKFDPETGEKLSFLGKLKFALQSSAAQQILKSKYKKITKNSADAKILASAGGGVDSNNILELSQKEILRNFGSNNKDQLFFE